MRISIYIKLLLLSLVCAAAVDSYATHNRAGEITYEYLSPLTFRATIVTYSKITGMSASADRDSLTLDWGDGVLENVGRVNGPLVNGVPNGVLVGNDIKQNIYVSEPHTYQGVLPFYIISVTDQNRIEDIINIAQGSGSVLVPIYFEDTLKYLPPEVFSSNTSPLLLNPPIDFANILDTFYHNPNAFDPDGDSLFFSLTPSLQAANTQVPSYQFPDQFPPGPNNNFTINSATGEITWAVPQTPGIYNIAILIREYREGQCIGTMLRDMEIFVLDEPNDPPQIRPLADTCVVAGDTLNINVTATDPNGADVVTLTAQGSPFQIDPSRVSFNAIAGNPANATLSWRTECSDIRSQFYQVVFKAEDDFINSSNDPAPLVDLETWLIQVIPPAPDSLEAVVVDDDIQLTWFDPYACADDSEFLYFSVYRRIGCENIDRVACETGLSGTDYELLATDLTTYSYLDMDVDRGNVYSYRIVATFGEMGVSPLSPPFNLVESVPSIEACIELPLNLPVITNVSVDVTDPVNGEIFVQWSKPKAGPSLLDTLIDLPPYTYELYRSEGFTGSGFTLINTSTAPSFAAFNDTNFVDVGLNTEGLAYSYKVIMYAENFGDTLGETSTASSIFTTITSSDQALEIAWQEEVPWLNTEYTIFRAEDDINAVYDSIGVTDVPNFIDTGLINDSVYCYFIRSSGMYTSSGLLNPLINLSQRTCATPIDTLPPCAPTVTVSNDCETLTDQIWEDENYQNRLSWVVDPVCADDAVSFNVFYSPDEVSDFTLLGNTSDTFFVHQLFNSIAGCYIVTAIDEKGNESTDADTICLENCAVYNLPNVFTPNGDGANDLFTPFEGWRFVEEVDLKIYNRWGNVVMATKDPAINWDGTDLISGKALNDGVYLFSGFYFVRKLDGSLEKFPVQPNEKGGGFIHLIRE